MTTYRAHYALLTLAISALAAGCGPSVTSVAPEIRIVHDDNKQEAPDIMYKDCGDEFINGNECNESQEPTAVQTCMNEAFAACTPAEARVTLTTIEGAPIPTMIRVEPAGEGDCGIVYFVDTTQDSWGQQERTRSECTELTVDGCGALTASECSMAEPY